MFSPNFRRSLLAAAWLLSAGAQAQEAAVPLTLEQATRLALEANPTLSAARREVEATEGQLLQGSLRPNPEFTYQADDASRAARSSTFELGLPFETGGKRDARVRAAGLGREVAQAELGGVELRLRATVVSAFFDVLAAQELRANAEDSVRLAQRATDVTSKRVAAGKVSPVEETRARVAEANARVALTQADSELRNARRRLSSLWGNASPSFTEASGEIGELPPLPSAADIEQRLPGSPQLLRARRELERRTSLVEVERSRTVPDVTLNLGVKRSIEVPGQTALLGFKVPLPVSNRNQGNLLEALRREDKARDELQAAQVGLASAALQALERIAARRQEAELLRNDVLPGARSAYDAAVIGFENGKFSFLEVLDAQRTLVAAQSQYLNSVANFHRALAELDGLVGSTR